MRSEVDTVLRLFKCLIGFCRLMRLERVQTCRGLMGMMAYKVHGKIVERKCPAQSRAEAAEEKNVAAARAARA